MIYYHFPLNKYNETQRVIDDTRNAIAIPTSFIIGDKIIISNIMVPAPNNLDIKIILLFSFDNNFDVCI